MKNVTNILIVDDEQDIAELLTDAFTDAGYQAKYALSAKDAFEIVASGWAKVVISDMRMPDESGVDFLICQFSSLLVTQDAFSCNTLCSHCSEACSGMLTVSPW